MLKDKNALRRKMRALRDSAPDRAERDKLIFEKFFSLPQVKGAKVFFVYHSFGSEADTHAILARLLAEGKTVCLPRVEGGEMSFVSYEGQALERGKFGIAEPQGERTSLRPDVVVLPMLAWNGRFRLGYGGGYYDRFLAGCGALKIGIAYAFQRTEEPFMEEFDVPADILVTDAEIYDFGNREEK